MQKGLETVLQCIYMQNFIIIIISISITLAARMQWH